MPDLTTAITAALDDLYERAEVPRPSVARCIAPLAELLGAYNLTATELSPLTSQKASEHLLKSGALLDSLADANADPLAGFLYADRRHGAIFVERSDLLTRRRFSVAHELGHYVLHFRPVFLARRHDADEGLAVTDAFPPPPSEETTPDQLPLGRPGQRAMQVALPSFEQMEREANQFAVELLMPFPLLWELTEPRVSTVRKEDLVWRLATDLLVSRSAMEWRLGSLRLLRPPTTPLAVN